MKAREARPEAGRHPAHSWVDAITFDQPDDASAQKLVLEREGFEVRLHDERRLQRYWFRAPRLAGIHVQVAAKSYETLRERLKENTALVLPAAIRCPSCGSNRVQYPQMTRKFVFPTLIAEAMVFFRLMERECYCEDCHHTWVRTPPLHGAQAQTLGESKSDS